MERKSRQKKVLSVIAWIVTTTAAFILGLFLANTLIPPAQSYPFYDINYLVSIQCWGEDMSDGQIGGWVTSYPNCGLDDGGGASNADYEGAWYYKPETRELCVEMQNLRTNMPPDNTLAVGFEVTLYQGMFKDNTTSKIISMQIFTRQPTVQNKTVCEKLAD
jgi:hypothetical protein